MSDKMKTRSIKLENCECMSQEDKEIFVNIIGDARDRREEVYKSRTNQSLKSMDQELLKSYEIFDDLVQNFKTCHK
jgi:hypothetical protein